MFGKSALPSLVREADRANEDRMLAAVVRAGSGDNQICYSSASISADSTDQTTSMSTKRKHSESNEIVAVHADRQAQVPGSIPRPAKKPRRHDPNKPLQKQVHASSVNTIKKKIRDVSRRLSAENIPANVRIEDERALTAYQQELASAEHMKKRNKMIGKYHKVRFFGRTPPKLPLDHQLLTNISLRTSEGNQSAKETSQMSFDHRIDRRGRVFEAANAYFRS